MYRQGDILLIKIIEIPSDAIKQKKRNLTILAYGEKTGHMHAIKSDCVIEYKTKNDRFFKIEKEVILSHGLREEIENKIKVGKDHDFIEIPEGTYKLIQQREYTPEKIRKIVD